MLEKGPACHTHQRCLSPPFHLETLGVPLPPNLTGEEAVAQGLTAGKCQVLDVNVEQDAL